MAARQRRFLADLIAIRSYTGEEGPAVARTLEELRAVGCDDVWMDSAGNALGRIGSGRRVILYDAHLDTNEVADAERVASSAAGTGHRGRRDVGSGRL